MLVYDDVIWMLLSISLNMLVIKLEGGGRVWRTGCREETLADNEKDESLPEVNMTRNIAECIET